MLTGARLMTKFQVIFLLGILLMTLLSTPFCRFENRGFKPKRTQNKAMKLYGEPRPTKAANFFYYSSDEVCYFHSLLV